MRVPASMREVMPAPPGWGGMTIDVCAMTARLAPQSLPGFDFRQMRTPATAQDGPMHPPIETIEAFYANALPIEREAAQRYDEFARHFEERGEDALAGLCANLADLERRHF